jgi:hypothetical protein
MKWWLSVPIWGDEFIAFFIEKTLPALREALHFEFDTTIVAHTDRPQRLIEACANGPEIRVHQIPNQGQWFQRMSYAHRQMLQHTDIGDAVMLLTADMVIDSLVFDGCRRAFDQGRKLVVCNATRAIAEDWPGMNDFTMPNDLSRWGWEHRHQMTRDATWPDGKAQEMPRVYFESGDNVVCRAHMPHPLAVLIDGRPLPFTATVDSDLIANFRPEEIHVVTDPDDMAVIELSPRDKRHPSRDADEPLVQTDTRIADRYHTQHLAYPIYRWVLGHRIVVKGANVDCGDDGAVDRLLTESR